MDQSDSRGGDGTTSVMLLTGTTSDGAVARAQIDASLLTDEAAVEHPGPHQEEGQQEEHEVVVVPGTWRSKW